MEKEHIPNKLSGGERKFNEMTLTYKQYLSSRALEDRALVPLKSFRAGLVAAREEFTQAHPDTPLSPESENELASIEAEAEAAAEAFRQDTAPYAVPDEETIEEHERETESVPSETGESQTAQETELPSQTSRVDVVESEYTHTTNEFSTLSESLYDDPEYVAMERDIMERRPDKYGTELGRTELERNYARAYPERFALYQKQESTRVYRDDSGAPNIEQDHTYQQLFKAPEYGGLGYTNDTHGIMSAYAHILSHYPEKAKAYAETDERMKRMLEARNGS